MAKAQQKNFQNEFWRRVKVDLRARDVMEKIPSNKRDRIVRLLEAISDPQIEMRLKLLAKQANDLPFQQLFQQDPSRKETGNLVRRLRTIARDMDRILGPSRLAEDCRLRAGRIRLALAMDDGLPKAPSVLTYKAFWKHVPIAMLCGELGAPQYVSFDEVQELLRCACSVDEGKLPGPRSIEREYKKFLLLYPKFRNSLNSVARSHFTRELIDTLREILLSTK